ncbi:MAG: tRNA epoxyqueuosine(34) reductase QueG [Bacteroidales bacterium]
MVNISNFEKALIERASQLGFIDLCVVELSPMDRELSLLQEMISDNYHGSMGYLERNHPIRKEPQRLLEGAKRAVVTLTPYRHPLKGANEGRRATWNGPKIASFALGVDYHYTIKERLHLLTNFIDSTYPNSDYRVFTDSAPIFEKALAERGGLGFVGKSGLLISPTHGIFTLIGVIITTAELPLLMKKRLSNHCGRCTGCIDACPTKALIAPFKMDAKRCISYSTIEDKNLYKISEGEGVNNREGMIFGCDICLEACPWSRVGSYSVDKSFAPLILSDGRSVDRLCWEEWLEMDSQFFSREFSNSALLRAGLEKIKNSVEYAMANRGEEYPSTE